MSELSHGIAITTYKTKPNCDRLYKTLESLYESKYPGAVFIIDDGSSNSEHLKWLESIDQAVILRKNNGGVARAKNTCLRVLKNLNVDIGFLADDDILFKGKWWEPYLEAYRRTNISHFSWGSDFEPSMKKEKIFINSYPVMKQSYLNGCFLMFNKAVLNTVGGFRILPAKWGHEHVNWTRRIIEVGLAPFQADIVNSNDVIELLPLMSSIDNTQKNLGHKFNVQFSDKRVIRQMNIYCEIQE